MDNYLRINDWRVKENSTVTYSVGGLILSKSGAITANYWLSENYDAEVAQSHRNAELHLHDLSTVSYTHLQYPIGTASIDDVTYEQQGEYGDVSIRFSMQSKDAACYFWNYEDCLLYTSIEIIRECKY